MSIEKPLARVAQLAIHLDREVNEKGLVLNKQEHLAPLFAMAESKRGVAAVVAEPLGIDPNAIVATDLMLFDLTAPTIGGADGRFLFSARLDNLAMCHAATRALLRANAKVDDGTLVPIIALFDHEEVGSGSAYGAEAPILPTVLERIVNAVGGSRDEYHRIVAGSLCVSADMAHAVHPNYAEKAEARHKVYLDGGPVIKVNAQQRYATCGKTAALFAEICARQGIPVQRYTHRTDLPCGSTIGPITATLLGIRTVDVGNAMLSMHSAREMTGTMDHERMTRALAGFFAENDPF